MGKSYSYSIVVESSDKLLINDQDIAPPTGVAANGDPLGWALDQVRQAYRDYYEDDNSCELTLSVRDHRPGGLVRRARFRHPDGGIDLETFLGGQHAGTAASADEPEEHLPETSSEEAPEEPHNGVAAVTKDEAQLSVGGPEEVSAADDGAERESHEVGPTEAPEASEGSEEPAGGPATQEEPDEEPDDDVDADGAQEHMLEAISDSTEVVVRDQPEPPQKKRKQPKQKKPKKAKRAEIAKERQRTADETAKSSYEQRIQSERGWKKIDRKESTRPQVGSAENEGKSKRAGLLAEARKQRVVGVVVVILAVIAVIVGFRVFGGGTDYEAICVDQRTMTRAVTGLACEDNLDTNHRWWFSADVEELPTTGERVPSDGGTFDEPSGDDDTINWNVESVE